MRFLRTLFRRKQVERELDEEVAAHLAMETERNRARGMGERDAREAALRAFGSVAEVKEDVRASWGARLLDELRSDVRVGARSLLRDRGFSLVVILTLALGVGANTAIFSVVNGVLLKPLPYGGGERLVRVSQQVPRAGITERGFSPLELRDLREGARTLAGVAEYHTMWFNLFGHGEPRRVQTGVVSSSFFDVFGVAPIAGRGFVASDEQPGAPAVLLLSHAFWQRAFGGDPGVIGQSFEMNDRPHVVVGVLPPIPLYPDENDVYMPTSACPFRSSPAAESNRGMRMSEVFARLADGVTLDEAHAELAGLTARMISAHPADYGDSGSLRLLATPVREELVRDWRVRLYLLLAVAAGVLLIVCANVANLTLARGLRRQHEMSVRAALGAGRRRLVRQLLTEGMILSLVGGLVGLGLAVLGHGFLVETMARFSPRASEIRIDGVVLAFTLLLSIATGLVFAAIPALPARRDVAASIREDHTRSGGGRTRGRLRSALVVVQVGFSFMLLIGAGLALRSLVKLEGVDPGFQTENVLTMRVDLDWARVRGQANAPLRAQAYERLLERVRGLSGVRTASVATTFPLSTIDPFSGPYQLEGRPPEDAETLPRADVRIASPGYFATIGVPLIAGRDFAETDGADAAGVVLVNAALARRQFPGEDPLGKRVSTDGGESWKTIVGVVGDARQYGLDREAGEEMYLPLRQMPPLAASLLVRSTVSPMGLAREIREAIRAVDPRQPIAQVRTLEEVRSATLSTPRATTAVIALFAILALVVTAAGVGGVLALTVSQRSREIALRMALGARRGDVLAMVVRQGLSMVVIGLVIGTAGAFVLGRLMASFLYEVRPHDPLTFAGVAVVLVGVAALACVLPARRAASIDPMEALRAS